MKIEKLNRHFFIFLILILCPVLSFADEAATEVLGYDIFIVAGQSNAVGVGLGDPRDSSATTAVDRQIKQLGRYSADHMKIIPMGEKLQHWGCEKGGCALSFAPSFARQYVQNFLQPDRQVLLVPAALGGSGSFQWDSVVSQSPVANFTDSTLLRDDLIQRIRYLRQMPGKNIFRGLLWHQGETDALCLHPKAWCASLTRSPSLFLMRIEQLFSDLRLEAGVDFPILAGGFVPAWGSGHWQLLGYKRQIEGSLAKLGTRVKRFGFVSSHGLTSNAEVVQGSTDDIHFSAAAQTEFGVRYFRALQKVLVADP